MLEAWMRSYRPERAVRRATVRRSRSSSTGCRRARGACARTRTRTAACCCAISICPTSATTAWRSTRNGTPEAEATRLLGRFLRDVFRANEPFRELPPVRPGRDRVQPARRGVRGDRQGVAGRDPAGGRAPVAARPRHGDPERAHVRRLARGLPAHGPARLLQLLRSVHAHHRFDVQPAREVARDRAQARVAAQHLVVELPADVARVAPGPQRVHAPGPGFPRRRRQQEGERRARVPTARRELPALGRRPLPAHARLRQRHRRREAAAADVAVDRRRRAALHAGPRHMGLGEQRRHA